MGLGVAIGAITFTGSIVAFAKLQGLVTGAPLVFPGQHPLNAAARHLLLVLLIVWFVVGQPAAAFWAAGRWSRCRSGFLLILPIGGADMPVVISMLNSYSGWAACGIGFTLANTLLIITGALVGSSGAILSYIMCKGMNRSIFNVILGGFGTEGGAAAAGAGRGDRSVKSGSAEDAAFIMKNASSVDHRAGLRHGGGPGAACAARDGRHAEEGGRQGALRHPSGRGPHAGPHERAAGRGQRAL